MAFRFFLSESLSKKEEAEIINLGSIEEFDAR